MANAREKKQQSPRDKELNQTFAQVEKHLWWDRVMLVDGYVVSRNPREDPLDEETETTQELREYLPDECQAELAKLPVKERYLAAKLMIEVLSAAERPLDKASARELEDALMREWKRQKRHHYHAFVAKKFIDWVAKAQDPSHWITWCKLPSMFRYAMRRVAMPQRKLRSRLESYGFDPRFVDFEDEEKRTFQLESSVLVGAEYRGERHVSGEYNGHIPKGLAFLEQQGTGSHSASMLASDSYVGSGSSTSKTNEESKYGHNDTSGHKESLILKLKLNVRSRLQAIHADVKRSRLTLQAAQPKFRTALGIPDISDRELSMRLYENDVPADCYFGIEATSPDPQRLANIKDILQDLEAGLFSASKVNNIFGDLSKFTPDNSRKGSLASDPVTSEFKDHPSQSSNSTTHPTTPPAEPLVLKPIHAQGLNDVQLDETEVLDVVKVNDAETGEAPIPDTFPYLTDEDKGSEDEETDEEVMHEIMKYDAMVDQTLFDIAEGDQSMNESSADSTDQSIPFLSSHHRQIDAGTAEADVPASFTLLDDKELAAIAMPPPQDWQRDLSRHSGAPNDQSIPPSPTTSHHPMNSESPLLASPKRRPGWLKSGRGPFGGNYPSGKLSESPKKGDTKDLWGIPMSTHAARELGTKIGLPDDFVSQRIRTLTPRRDNIREIEKATLNTTIPSGKRKASPSSSEGHLRKHQKLDDDPSLFAKEGEDHRAFLRRSLHDGNIDKPMKSKEVMELEKSKKRCENCNNTKCICIRDFSLESFRATPSALDQSTGPRSSAFGSDSEAIQELQRLASKTMMAASSQHNEDGCSTSAADYSPQDKPEDGATSVASEKAIRTLQDKNDINSIEPDCAQTTSSSSWFRSLIVVKRNGWTCMQAPPPTPGPANRAVPHKNSEGMLKDLQSPKPLMSSNLPNFGSAEDDNQAWRQDVELHKKISKDADSDSLAKPTSPDSAMKKPLSRATFERVLEKCDNLMRRAEGFRRAESVGRAKSARRARRSKSSVGVVKKVTADAWSQAYMSMKPDILEASRKRRISANNDHPYSYFHMQNASSSRSGSSAASNLNRQFDSYRDDPNETPDTIGIDGTIKYLFDLGVNLDEVAVLAVLTELNAPTMGEIMREGFVAGWKSHGADNLSKQQAVLATLRNDLANDHSLFRRVYRHTFLLARNIGQKAVQLDAAIEYWRLLLQSPSLSWNTSTTPWLTWWIEYLEAKWKKSVNRDMWDQTGAFVMKSLEDESMSWWSEDGAWPGVLDEFVAFVEAKRGQSDNDAMQIG